MRLFQSVLAFLALLCVPACQQEYKPSAELPLVLRPIPPQNVTFKRGYYSGEQVDQKPVLIPPISVPSYPKELRNSGIDGLIHLAVAIDERGNVSEVGILTATDEAFAVSARETVMRWKFKPGRKAGKAVGVWLLQPVRFTVN
jgi:TonB family C-terminal domain